MNKIPKLIFLLLLAFTLPTSSFAKEITARATLPYKFYNSDTRAEGMEKARMSAWKKYTSSFSVARKSTYRANKKEILKNLPDLIVEELIVQEKNDKESKIYKVSLRVNLMITA